MCGWPAKMMVHIGGVETKELMSEILDLLRPGDVLTHAYSGAPNIAGVFTNIVQDGKLLPAALAGQAARRDLRRRPRRRQLRLSRWRRWRSRAAAARHDLLRHPRVLRQLAGHALSAERDEQVHPLGFSLEQVVAMATITPAKIINRAPKIGTLQVGAPGDVAIMEVVEGPISFVDTRNNRRDGQAVAQARADGDQRRAVRPAVSGAVRGALRSRALYA